MVSLTSLLRLDHEKNKFSCGKISLDDYLHKQASQDVKRKLAVVFVLSDDNKVVKGYYTLSNASIPKTLVPVDISKIMPGSYTDLPVTLLGRLAVDKAFTGQGLGTLLLLDALKKSFDVSETSMWSIAVIVDPLDKEAEGFYLKYGFEKLPDSGRMFLAMKTIAKLFA